MAAKEITLGNTSENPSIQKSIEKVSRIERLFFLQARDTEHHLEQRTFSRTICTGEAPLSLEANKATHVAEIALSLEKL